MDGYTDVATEDHPRHAERLARDGCPRQSEVRPLRGETVSMRFDMRRPGCPPSYPALPAWNEQAGSLEGAVNLVDLGRVAGWARNLGQPDAPVCLEVLIGERVVARALADRYREDLFRAGYGRGEHGFEIALPRDLAGTGPLVVRRASDGAVIEGWHGKVAGRVWRRPAATGDEGVPSADQAAV